MQVSIWFLISMKVFTRIGIKKKREKGVCVCVCGGGGGGGGVRGGGLQKCTTSAKNLHDCTFHFSI